MQADKGNITVVTNTEDYNNKIEQLDPTTYKKLKNPTQASLRKINTLTTKAILS